MRYQDYKKKMLRIRKVIDVFYHLRFVFLGIAIVAAASITTLDLTKGNITEVSDFEISYTYGDEIKYSGSAFMGDVSFEFRKMGQSEKDWTEKEPRLVGIYEARAKSLGNHGYKYSKVSSFEIKPYPVDINIAVSKIDYGNEHPKLEYKLLGSDTLNDKDVVVTYADLTKNTTTASIDLDSIKVHDKDGNDITSCYAFTTEDKEVTFNKVNITVNYAASATYSYTGESHTNDEYTVSGEFPYPDKDELVVDGGIEVSEIGVHNNDHTAKVMTDGVENENYVVKVNDNSITITKAYAVTISSKSLSKTYDGEPFEDEEFELEDLTVTPALLPGHHLKLVEFVNKDQWEVCSNINNEFNFDIVDDAGEHVEYNDLYQSVSKTYGKINIAKRDVTITSKPLTAVFDNKYHSIPEIKSVEGLADGDEASVVLEEGKYTSVKNPTTGVDNELNYVITRGEIDVSSNYNIIPIYEKIVITRDTFRFKFNSINDTQGTITYDKHNYPYYYAIGTDDYQMFETDDDRYNAGVLDTTFKNLPEGWKYKVSIPSSNVMMDVKEGGYSANVSAIEYHIYDNSEPRLEVTSYYTSDNFIFGYFDGDEFKANELPKSTIVPKALNITVNDRYDKEFNNRTLAQDMVIDPNNPDSCVKYTGLVDGDYPDVKFANSTVTSNKNASDTPYNVVFTYGVKDSNGTNAKDITNNYSITVNKDSIDAYVSKKVITVEPVNITKTYDGTNTFTPKCTYSATLGEVVSIKSGVQYETSSPNVNDPETPYTYTLKPEDITISIGGTNMTSNYDFDAVAILKSASVSITQREINISSNSNSSPTSHVYYDEKPHGVFINTNGTSSSEMSIEGPNSQNTRGLISGHKLVVNNPQSITDPGVLEIESTADLGFKILDKNDADVTSNYKISQTGFHIEVVKNYIDINIKKDWTKYYDGLPFEVQGLENVPYGEFRDYDSTEMSKLYNVTFEAFAPGVAPLQPGHKLQVTKYKEAVSNAVIHVGHGGDEGIYKFDYRVIDTNNGNEDVTNQYNIDTHQDSNHFFVEKTTFYIYCNGGEREYDGTKSTPPTSETFELTSTQSAPAFYFSNNYQASFFTKYSLRCKFDNGAYDPDQMWRVGTYNFNATIKIYDKIGEVEYDHDAMDDDIGITIVKSFYGARISKRSIKLSVIAYSNGKEKRWINEGTLASGDAMYFGDGTTFEEALKDGSRTKYTYAAELANIRIYRSGVDVTDCYDIKIEKTNNS